jgi:hypothetical protein
MHHFEIVVLVELIAVEPVQSLLHSEVCDYILQELDSDGKVFAINALDVRGPAGPSPSFGRYLQSDPI